MAVCASRGYNDRNGIAEEWVEKLLVDIRVLDIVDKRKNKKVPPKSSLRIFRPKDIILTAYATFIVAALQ